VNGPPDPLFWVLFSFCWGWVVFWMCVGAYRCYRHPRRFRKLDSSEIRFREGWTSGGRRKGWFCASASGVLEVTVTKDEVWLRLYFPFNAFMSALDVLFGLGLEERLPVQRIRDIRQEAHWYGTVIVLDYVREDGGIQSVSLGLRKPEGFARAVADAAQDISVASGVRESGTGRRGPGPAEAG
jgi:hypothetical protein